MDRAGFLRNGAVVAVGAMGASRLVDSAGSATGPIAELDLAVARLAVATEILAAEFYTEAIASKQFAGNDLKYLKRALFNEQEHLAAVSEILTGARQTAATADDFTITFPKGTFDSRSSIAKQGTVLEAGFLGAYLGAVDELTAPDLKTTAARIAASEARHLGVFQPAGVSFPLPLDLATASAFLDPYLS